ncbi:WG repeat protein [Marinoscillum furvescens DSM 4134]|uniref:WG repeat protein n=2 Tax=Marinoscillum furvescens TaxID=1026 RepID=A0A3D9L6E1_MARFU|nr:WG repeat protein [Marinoscillum furvescens DSM 4134]
MMAVCSISLHAEGLHIITSGGFQGVANSEGQVVVPAIYERLGWSDGESAIVGSTVGFYENGRWGLINIKSKKISSAKYAILKPFHDDLFEAGVRAKFSNRVQRGLIDTKGRVVVDLKYYTIDKMAGQLRVAKYTNGKLRYGLVSPGNEVLVPMNYANIHLVGELLVMENDQNQLKPISREGVPLLAYWVDALSAYGEDYLVEKEGYFGVMTAAGELKQPIHFKRIDENGKGLFPNWKVKLIGDESVSMEILCDSIVYHQTEDLLIAHVNRTEHILAASDLLFKDQQRQLRYINQGFLVTENSAFGQWEIHKTDGREIATGFDSVAVDAHYFFTKSRDQWDVYNLFGRKINERPFQAVGHSHARNVPVKKNDYWGWINFTGERIVNYRYDAVVPATHPDHFLASSYRKWGVSSFADEWLILPEYDSVYAHGQFYIGTRGRASYVLNHAGEVLHSVPFEVSPLADSTGALRIYDRVAGASGVITHEGYYVHPQYQSVSVIGGYYELVDSTGVTLLAADGRELLSPKDGVEKVLTFEESFFHIIEDGKHGFVDTNGKLRIANRYDSAQYFQEGYAPIKLMGKWGFIDKSEILRIQPFYLSSSVYKNGLAIVQVSEGYGLITRQGEEVVATRWKYIERLGTGNYRVTDWDGKVGLVDVNGRFIVRPNYDSLEDTPKELIIASRAGQKGVLDYKGFTRVPFDYTDIQIKGDYLLLRDN